MRLSGLAVATVLLFSPLMLAQHSSGGSSSGSSSGSSGGGSHGGGYSGGGGSSSSSGGGHSSGGSSSHTSGGSGGSGSHGSGVSGGRGSSGSSSRGSGTSLSHGGGSSSRSIGALSHTIGRPEFSSKAPAVTLDNETGRQVQSMIKSGKSLEEIRQFVNTKTGVNPDEHPIRIETNEKRSFASLLRHPFQKPQTAVVADLRHRLCPNGSCRVCPAGSSANGKGGCSGTSSNFCASGAYWSNNSCQVIGQAWRYNDCRLYNDNSSLGYAQQRMRQAQAERETACNADPAGSACSEKNVKYQRAVADYNLQTRRRGNRFQGCMEGSAFGYFDPMF